MLNIADTRHNAGHWCVQQLVEETGATLENRRLVRTGQINIAGHATVMALSRTYVNLSGEAAEYLLTRYQGRPGAVDRSFGRHKPARRRPSYT